MNIASGMDRLGKVVFWVSWVGATFALFILSFADGRHEIRGDKIFATAAILVGHFVLFFMSPNKDPMRNHPWVCNFWLWYSVVFAIWLFYRVPVGWDTGDVGILGAYYFAPWIPFLIAYYSGKYVLRGFITPK